MINHVVIMGVSGCGKSTLGRALAEALSADFIEGDERHPRSNVEKMAAGVPLTDEDRVPFLENVATSLGNQGLAVASCSALKRAYRDLLRVKAGPILFVLPDLSTDALAMRMQTRQGHFMPPSLLASQLATLERPQPDEDSLIVSGDLSPDEQVNLILQRLGNDGIVHTAP